MNERQLKMLYIVLADMTLVLHLIFILFVLIGGLLILRNKKWVIIHLPAAIWASVVEFQGWICPLTPLENRFLEKGGGQIYQGGFIEHYLMPLIYPLEMTKDVQIILGSSVIIINTVVYLWVYHKSRHS